MVAAARFQRIAKHPATPLITLTFESIRDLAHKTIAVLSAIKPIYTYIHSLTLRYAIRKRPIISDGEEREVDWSTFSS